MAAERLQPGRVVANRGVQVRLSPDRQSIVASGSGIHFAEAAAPLMWPYQRDGKPPACQVSAHKDPVEAIIVADAFSDGLPWCGSCVPS